VQARLDHPVIVPIHDLGIDAMQIMDRRAGFRARPDDVSTARALLY